MNNKAYTATITVSQSPETVFRILREVPMWWSKDYEGDSYQTGDEFTIHHPGEHFSKQRLVEVIPDQKMVWLVTDSTLHWLQRNQHEWTGTKMVFDIRKEGENTLLQFTHEGLVPGMESYERCSEGWTLVISDWLLHSINSIHRTITVNATAEQAIELICQPQLWWVTGITGDTAESGDKFHVPMGKTHIDFEVVQAIPQKRVIWKVTNSHIPWLKNIQEWTGTEVYFGLTQEGDFTRIHFSHIGLFPGVECYDTCEQGWEGHITNSLARLINEGEGLPKQF